MIALQMPQERMVMMAPREPWERMVMMVRQGLTVQMAWASSQARPLASCWCGMTQAAGSRSNRFSTMTTIAICSRTRQ